MMDMGRKATLTHKLLMDSPPLVVQRELAVALQSLDKAIILQQIHYLTRIAKESKNKYTRRNGKWWVYNSYRQWQEEHFPFWSESKIGRFLRELESDGFIESSQLDAHKYDQRKWYAICYDKLNAFLDEQYEEQCTIHRTKMVRSTVSECNDQSCQVDTIMSKTTPKNTPKTTAAGEKKESERDYLEDIVSKSKEEDLDAQLFGDKADRPKGYRDATDEEYAVCERVAELWTDGELPWAVRDIENALAAAHKILGWHDDDIRKTLFTIDQHHVESGDDGIIVTSPYSLRNVLKVFMTQQKKVPRSNSHGDRMETTPDGKMKAVIGE